MNLTQELQELRDTEPEKLGPQNTELFRDAIDDLSRSGIVDRSIKVGDSAPDFELTNQAGDRVRLSERLEHGPTIVSFYRGGWCPYCNIEMQGLQSAMSQIEGLGAHILAISPQRPDKAAEMSKDHGLTFDLLSDPQNSVAQQFGIVFHLHDEIQNVYDDLGLELPVWNDDDSFDLPVPATYVINRQSIIQMAFVDPDYTRRLDPTEIIRILRSISDTHE
jgi:peroxiredoxin